MPVSLTNSGVVYDALKKCGIGLVSALPETWLVHLIRMAEDDPKMILVRLAKEEEGVGISAGAHFAGVKSAMLMQHRGAPGRQIGLGRDAALLEKEADQSRVRHTTAFGIMVADYPIA